MTAACIRLPVGRLTKSRPQSVVSVQAHRPKSSHELVRDKGKPLFKALPSLFAGARCTRAPPFLGPYPSSPDYNMLPSKSKAHTKSKRTTQSAILRWWFFSFFFSSFLWGCSGDV